MHPFLLPKLTESSKSKKNYSKFSLKTKTKPVQNLFRHSALKDRTCIGYDKVIVIVLVWLTFVSLYSIVKVLIR